MLDACSCCYNLLPPAADMVQRMRDGLQSIGDAISCCHKLLPPAPVLLSRYMQALQAPRSAPARPLRGRLTASVRESSAEGVPAERRLFSFGMGYTTLALAHVAKQQGWCARAVAALSRCG